VQEAVPEAGTFWLLVMSTFSCVGFAARSRIAGLFYIRGVEAAAMAHKIEPPLKPSEFRALLESIYIFENRSDPWRNALANVSRQSP